MREAIKTLEARRPILGNELVDQILQPLQESLAAQADREDVRDALLDERKLVTIMFADISGFTALSERCDAERVREIINSCFERLVPIIRTHNGTIDKFIGDEIMALFGAPAIRERDAERALRAALEMKDELKRFNRDLGLSLGLHFGINSGVVVAGQVGTSLDKAYSVIGDAVNIASRLKSAASEGEIMVGPQTFGLAAESFVFEPLPPVLFKGKSRPFPIYRLIGRRDQPSPIASANRFRTPFVGREEERGRLLEFIEDLCHGRGGCGVVVGEAGMGKSRLLHEVRLACGDRVRWAQAHASPHSIEIDNWVIGGLVRSLAGIHPGEDLEGVRREFDCFLAREAPALSAALRPCLSLLMGLRLVAAEQSWLDGLDAGALPAHFQRGLSDFIHLIACAQPTVLVLEDLHWADARSVDLLEAILPSIAAVPVFVILTLRAQTDAPAWRLIEAAGRTSPERRPVVELHPFTARESVQLLGGLLDQSTMSAGLSRRISQRADGNPLCLEQILQSLVDREVIAVRDQKIVVLRSVETVELPATLQQILSARLDSLQRSQKRVLQVAAVIGRVFSEAVLAAVWSGSPAADSELRDALAALEKRLFIEPALPRESSSGLSRSYAFRHSLMQEAAYGSLLASQRREMHRSVGAAIESVCQPNLDEMPEILASHFVRGGDAERSVRYLLAAGKRARDLGSYAGAIRCYRQALPYLLGDESLRQRAGVLMKVALVCHLDMRYAESHRSYEEAFRLWQRAARVTVAASAPDTDRPLRVAWPEPPTLDPLQVSENNAMSIIQNLFSGLVEESPELDVIPAAAATWDVKEDGRRYTFWLRSGLRWTDGVPVTAGDFEAGIIQALDPSRDSPAAVFLYCIAGARAYHGGATRDPSTVGARARDERTLEILLEEPCSYFLHLLCLLYPVPRHKQAEHGDRWSAPENIVTNGPFRLRSWVPNEMLVFDRNPEYQGQFTGNLRQVQVISRPFALVGMGGDPTLEVLRMYEEGEIDVCDLDLVMHDLLAQSHLRRRYGDEYVAAPNPLTLYVGFDTTRPPFDDARVRRAMTMALNRKAWADIAWKGEVAPALGGFVPPGMPGHTRDIALPYDPAGARELLVAAGYPGGLGFPPVEMDVVICIGIPRPDDLVSSWRKDLGLPIEMRITAWQEVFSTTRQSQLFLAGWTADYPDPYNYLGDFIFSLSRWRDRDFLRLVSEARKTQVKERRLALYAAAERIMIEQAAVIPLVYLNSRKLLKPWVRQYPLSPMRRAYFSHIVVDPAGPAGS